MDGLGQRVAGVVMGVWLGLAATVGPSGAADQCQFGRPLTRNMTSDEIGLPVRFDVQSGQGIAWSVRFGRSYATPVVAGGRVYLGCNNALPRDPRHQGDRGVLLCLEEKTGRLLWQLCAPKVPGDKHLDWPGAGMCSPPTVEGDRLYMVTNRSEVVCLDVDGLADGNDGPYTEEGRYIAPDGQEPMKPGRLDADIIWRFDLRSGVGMCPHDSIHSSPLLVGDYLYLNTGNGVDPTHTQVVNPDAPALVVLDKRTGRLVGRDEQRIGHRIFHCAWSSPSMGRVGGRACIFFAGGDGVVYGFEPLGPVPPDSPVQSLRCLWRFDCDPTAPKTDLSRYLHNRSQGPSVIYAMPVFHDGRLYVASGGDYWWGKRQARLQCLDPSGHGDLTARGQVWSYRLGNHVLATPAVADGLVFIGDCDQTVHCIDARTGRACWTDQVKGDIWASPLVADGKVYFATRRGQVVVYAAQRHRRRLATMDLGEPISGSPVAANGRLYITTQYHLYAVGRSDRPTRAGWPE